MKVKINTALISCYDKTGLADFVGELVRLNPKIKIYSSSGTFKELAAVASNNLKEVSEYVGFKEMPDGLVKTLHPKIHSGILADLSNEEQKKYIDKNGIDVFDLVVVNLYPFKGGGFSEAKKNMDIGGVSLLESGVKNFSRIVVVSSKDEYDKILKQLRENFETEMALRLELAKKAISYLRGYMGDIDDYFQKLELKDVE